MFKEASALGAAGLDVTAITVAYDEACEREDDRLMSTASFEKRCLDLRRHRGAKQRVRSFIQRAGIWLARRAARRGVGSPQAFGPYAALKRAALNTPADLTIVHTEVALCVGAELLRRGRRVAVDFEDWHSEDLLSDAQSWRPVRLLRQVERTLARDAAYASTTSQAMSAALGEAYDCRPPAVITNSFPLRPLPPRSSGAPPSFFWFSQTIGPGRGLEEFLSAWSKTNAPSRVSLLGSISSAYRLHLLSLLPVERRNSLNFLPLVPPWDLPTIIASHEVGLALESTTPRNRDLTITNKILQYLNGGLAVVATDTAGQREVLTRAPDAGFLVNASRSAEYSDQLDVLLRDQERMRSTQSSARKAAEEVYSWEREAPRLVQLVEDALSRVA